MITAARWSVAGVEQPGRDRVAKVVEADRLESGPFPQALESVGHPRVVPQLRAALPHLHELHQRANNHRAG
jgi:hypothetical protein